MRLSKIKLAGFKSFVDPTTIHFPSNLIGIVGPNGCGKSNVIDAVRWVMGERSAKHLRGDSMADVIFNGSSSRKPVGSASIELIFDNSDGVIGGQYASYAEVSIRRALSRDGTSTYYLNNTRCRRKDITAIFLGTGLGPRAYAIIEQGMISRLIEAKPEELRIYIEEAAGISKFKERRRETEHRIRRTRENLERLADLREEVDKQLKHLERQRRVAERYKVYKQRERRLDAELLLLKRRELAGRLEVTDRERAAKQNTVDAELAALRGIETQIEKTRIRQTEAMDAFNDVQGRYYKVGAEIARLEQGIEHRRDLRQRQEEELTQAEHGLAEVRSHTERDEHEIAELTATLADLAPDHVQAARVASTSAEEAARLERFIARWQVEWDSLSEEAAGAQGKAHVERTRIEHLETQISELLERDKKIVSEREALSEADAEEQLRLLLRRDGEQKEELAKREAELTDLGEQIESRQEESEELAAMLDQQRLQLQEQRGRFAALEALQEAAFGIQHDEATRWLEHSGLAERPRLAQELEVQPGWERAVETVLGDYLQAVSVKRLDRLMRTVGDPGSGGLDFVRSATDARDDPPADTLAAKVSGAWCSLSLLNGILAAESLTAAAHLQSGLAAGQSVVTRDGVWLGPDWLRVRREREDESGLIVRESELRELREAIRHVEQRIEELETRRAAVRTQIEGFVQQRETTQSALNRGHRAQSELNARLSAHKTRQQHVDERIGVLGTEAIDIKASLDTAQNSLREARARLEQTVTDMSALEQRRGDLQERKATLETSLTSARAEASEHQETAQQLAIRFESRRSAEESMRQGLERLRTQAERLQRQVRDLSGQLEDGKSPLADEEQRLAEQLQISTSVKTELGAARTAVEQVEDELREIERQRTEAESVVENRRGALDEVRMLAKEIRVRYETVNEQLAKTGFDVEAAESELSADARMSEWESELETMRRRIERLGAINLASIEEYDEQAERKAYLDAQDADLTEALETLENAIRKIDRETRTRFKETFDRVDAEFKRIFPRLFGGGHAYLELSGDDLLSAGITVMARPPGKRNSTIHLLSGGEKALAAVALVFAIFELNPAPFCLLDEVDAPLDDANVARYCEILREMSERIQFVFITHNKITMEIASRLTGVTMQEPGVSRLVAVDVDEAVELAAV